MNLPTIYTVGSHAYRVTTVGESLGLAYCLFHANGWREKPVPGRPNAHQWRVSHRRFTTVHEVHAYAQSIFNGTNRSSSDV